MSTSGNIRQYITNATSIHTPYSILAHCYHNSRKENPLTTSRSDRKKITACITYIKKAKKRHIGCRQGITR